MRPTTADSDVLDYNALLHPGTRYEHPEEVVRHAGLTTAEKRAILASLGVGRVRDNVPPLSALSRGTEEPGVHRRDTRSLVPTDSGSWTPSGGKPDRSFSTAQTVSA
jgi:hypothetical protein